MKKFNVIFVHRLIVLICAFYIGAVGAYGQLTGLDALKAPSQPKDTVHAEGVLSVDKVQPGSTFQIAVVMTFDEGWHANANPAGPDLIPTQLMLPDYPDLEFGEVIYPEGDVLEITSIGKAPVYHDQAVIGVQATLGQTAQLQKVELPFKLTYQACSDEQCLLPKTVAVNIPMDIVGTDRPVQPINAEIFSGLQLNMPQVTPSATSETGEFRQALSKGYFWAFLFVFIGGVLTSLTPCVYPLIPITVSIFGANREASRMKSFLLSVTYVLGIALMYSILGVAVASTGAVFGQIMANPIVVGFVSVILVALGLSLIGVFELRLPYALQNKLNTVGGAGFGGAFAMGTVAGLIAAPCTGPALGAVLSFVATTGNTFLGFWLMLTYAIGMGLLFILIGTFSGLISSLPQSGGWMYVLENIFGVVIIAMALYFLKEVVAPLRALLDNSAPFFIIGGILLLLGVILGKFTQRFRDISRSAQMRKSVGILAAVFGLFVIVGSFTTV
ncbi:MAG: protein-disulfide reductase DsbD family protein, partial [Candidatus Poribacteria bacterium]|nr:protein-disulfide reductase DsbD family protein [Candidatus Poribacteria bacterium]